MLAGHCRASRRDCGAQVPRRATGLPISAIAVKIGPEGLFRRVSANAATKPWGVRPLDLGNLPRAEAFCLPPSMHLESGIDVRHWAARKTMLICYVVDQAVHMIDRDQIPHASEVCLECVQPQKLDTSENPLFAAWRRGEGSDRGLRRVRAGLFGLASLVFWAVAPLCAPFSRYAGALRPSSQSNIGTARSTGLKLLGSAPSFTLALEYLTVQRASRSF